MHQPLEVNTGEFKINNSVDIRLDRHPHTNDNDLLYSSLSQGGLALRMYYKPNLIFDAWKIEGVSIKLQFKDQNGVLMSIPNRGTTLNVFFNNASGFLNNTDRVMTCWTDGEFRPTTSAVSK